MADEGAYSGPGIRQVIFDISLLISRLDESQKRNTSEVLSWPADDVVADQIRDVMHFIPEGHPLFPTLRRYITDARSRSGEMRIVDVLPMLEMLNAALSNEVGRKDASPDARPGSATTEGPKGDFEMHHRLQPRISRGSGYLPEMPIGDHNEMTHLRPGRRPK